MPAITCSTTTPLLQLKPPPGSASCIIAAPPQPFFHCLRCVASIAWHRARCCSNSTIPDRRSCVASSESCSPQSLIPGLYSLPFHHHQWTRTTTHTMFTSSSSSSSISRTITSSGTSTSGICSRSSSPSLVSGPCGSTRRVGRAGARRSGSRLWRRRMLVGIGAVL